MFLEQDNEHYCPCDLEATNDVRFLQSTNNTTQAEEDDDDETVLWQVIYTCMVLLMMLVALLSDRVGADGVMLTAVTLFMAAEIITVREGLAGFANEGLITVLVLFVVAHGISVTGALDWYMGKLLGKPKTVVGAQLRLMIPIATVSAFLNNTPVVAVMIPIVQRWSQTIGISHQQLLVPLSFASILGGTCTLIGTSTNLVVVGLFEERYPDSETTIGLFDLGQYGVPIAIAGMTYIVLCSPFWLPGGKGTSSSSSSSDQQPNSPLDDNNVLLGARLKQWSPAAGRTVKRSGLNDSGGLFLVSVHRAATGNVHRVVGQDFVLNVGDILYFTGLVEEFGTFCDEHGLEVMTNETTAAASTETEPVVVAEGDDDDDETARDPAAADADNKAFQPDVPTILPTNNALLTTVAEDLVEAGGVPGEIGVTKESLLFADDNERLRSINRMTDRIRGLEVLPDEGPPIPKPALANRRTSSDARAASGPPKIVVTTDFHDSQRLVLVGIDAHDRPGLLLDISKGLLRLNLQLRHTEAAVIGDRSNSIWRCECMVDAQLPDLEEIWSVMNALLESESGVEAIKKRGLRVIRAVVTAQSQLIGLTAAEANFRKTYKAAIVAVQKGGQRNAPTTVRFDEGDVLVLQANDNSPLLQEPPPTFYSDLEEKSKPPSRSNSVRSLVDMLRLSKSESKDVPNEPTTANDTEVPDDVETGAAIGLSLHNEGSLSDSLHSSEGQVEDAEPAENATDADGATSINTDFRNVVWQDLRVLSAKSSTDTSTSATQREFLTAMTVAPKSQLCNKTAPQVGIAKLPGVFLVSIERPIANADGSEQQQMLRVASDIEPEGASSVAASSLRSVERTFVNVPIDEPLQGGDILWFAGSASAIGDLRKIPGLQSFVDDEVQKINEAVHNRRLVQAVVARKGPLVGKTVRDVRFRNRYGAAVISVHREGKRVHDHPGRVKLQAGDVLLLEAGPSFIQSNLDNSKSFALLAEVKDSAPPRLKQLIPALFFTFAMLAIFTGGVTSLLICALVASALMVATGILSQQEARDAVNWEVYITIACAFGIGTALTNSGVAGGVANFLVTVGEGVGIGDAGLYGAVYFATFFISNVVTNNAAAALLFPIAMDAAEQTGADRLLMSYTLMLGASASFMSPFGYTTNLLIYGPGGYKYKDFLVFGTPMQVVLWILSIVILGTSIPWWVSWLASAVVFLAVSATRMTNCRSRSQTPVPDDKL